MFDNADLILETFRGGKQMPGLFVAKRLIYKAEGAKLFKVDEATSTKIGEWYRDNTDIFIAMRKFAKPPFPAVYVQFDLGSSELGGLWVGQETVGFERGIDWSVGRRCDTVSGYICTVSETGYKFTKAHTEAGQPEETMTLLATTYMEVLWLLMHRPGVVLSTRVPVQRKIVRGKMETWRAHDVLKIDLAPKELTRIFANGSRGSGVVEHEVRGHWMHWRLNRGCEHGWQKVEVEPFAPERYECPKCASIRVWRKDHVRGDTKRGTKFHTYEVTHSGLEKRPEPEKEST